ncbi:hypothetical protein [Luteolibacter marinus]|uniref:hypothetical protein n=1 Tax=Luteolibacter marinus TaxID=2776705 RepID=UPI0018683EE9|nr:hypothetical protein [Luteolibacter marinus]
MKTTPTMVKQSEEIRRTAVLGILLGCSMFANALAKGKPGGGGNEAPPPVEVPFVYHVTWIDTENPNDVLNLRDVSPDGTAVGAIVPEGIYGSNVAVVSFPDGNLLDVQAMLHAENRIPATWRATYAYRICNNHLIALDLYDDSGSMYCGALQLNPDRTMAWFSYFADPGGADAALMDASESGDFLIASGEITDGPVGIQFSQPADLHVWTPLAGTMFGLASDVPGMSGGWYESSISDYPAALFDGGFVNYPASLVPIQLPDPGTGLTLLDVGADGTVVARIAGAQIRRNKYAPDTISRWSPTSGTWDPIYEGGGNAFINASGEIAISSGGDLHVFQDAFGAINVNAMVNPTSGNGWAASNNHQLLGLSNKAGPDSKGGVIVGKDLTAGRSFILTPASP